MRLRNSDIISASSLLQRVVTHKMDPLLRLELVRFARKFAEEAKALDETREGILREFAGDPKLQDNRPVYDLTDDQREEFWKKWRDVLQGELEINVDPFPIEKLQRIPELEGHVLLDLCLLGVVSDPEYE